jgi:GTPase SAR1 family protein
MTLYSKYIMTDNGFKNFYQTTPQPGVKGGMNACTNWAPFQTYTQHTSTGGNESNVATTLKGGNFRFVLLVLGPTGSGKTAVIKYLKRYATLINNMGVRAGEPWIQDEVSYDHHIINHPDYKQQVDKIISPPRSTLFPEIAPPADEGRARTAVATQHIINNPHTHKQFKNAYETTRRGIVPKREHNQMENYIIRRKKFGFLPSSRKSGHRGRGVAARNRNNCKINIDTQNAPDITVYRNLRKSISEGKNIVFESTGKKWDTSKKIFQTLVTATNSCNKFRYIVLASLNIIDDNENKRRIIERFKNQMIQYQHYSAAAAAAPSAPRLPNPSLNILQQNKKLIYRNMRNLIQLCTTKEGINSNIGLCPGVGIDLLFIFNQNQHDWRVGDENVGTPGQMIYPAAIIPLSKRSIYITRYTKTYNVKFHPNIRSHVNNLLNDHGADQEQQYGKKIDPISEGVEKRKNVLKWQKKIKQIKRASGRIGGRKKTVKSRTHKKNTTKRRRIPRHRPRHRPRHHSRRKKKTRRKKNK